MSNYFTLNKKRYENNVDGRFLLATDLTEKDIKVKTIGIVRNGSRRRVSINTIINFLDWADAISYHSK